jgi:type IV pilus assembly protein PilB
VTLLAHDSVLQLALDKAWLSPAQLELAQARLANQGGGGAGEDGLVDLLVAEGSLTAGQVATLAAEEWGLESVDLTAVRVPDAVRDLVPRPLAERHRLLPLAREGGALRVAVSNPRDVEGIDDLRHLLGLDIETCMAPAEDIARALERVYGGTAGAPDAAAEPLPATGGAVHGGALSAAAPGPDTTAADTDEDAPIIRMVHAILLRAVQRRASDVHFEPLEKRFRVRYRIDGVLHEAEDPPKRLQRAIISRLKILANISIAERRVPQDGRIQLTLDGRPLDLRAASLPTAHGESMVLRILDRGSVQLGLPELGFLADSQALVEQLITLPDGLLLVTGPTGSGKTTTLYSCLHHLNHPDRKIVTVEDPVEYQLSGINQVPVRHDIGMTFGSALRAMLRQAPNTIMVGEIRDLETAEIAINASLTGHLVFSTLHTNDATSALARLADLGVKPFLLSASVRAVLAQRLVRKICRQCCRPYTPSAAEWAALELGPRPAAVATLLRGVGCAACEGTGYRGRTGIFELFVLGEEIRQMLHDPSSLARLRAKARALGMRTLREDGAMKVIAGLTTIEEVVSMTLGEAS